MSNFWKSITLTAVFFAAALNVFAADVKMSIEPKLISMLDRAILKVVYTDTDGEAIDFPEVEGLTIEYQGPSREYRMVNFKTTSSVTHSYLVTPEKTGKFTIGPITATYKGGKKTLTAELEVINSADDQKAQEISELMFSEIVSQREAPHVSEPFELTLKIYIRDGIQTTGGFNIVGGTPEQGLDGEIQWQLLDKNREQRDGQIFNVYTAKATVKTITAGTFTFQPQVQLNVVIPRQDRRSYPGDPFFGDLWGRQETRRMILDCNALQVDVRPVPVSGRPDSFTGGIGRFDFDASVGPGHVTAGEPVTVKMRITGRGNLTQITPPKIAESDDYKLYEVRSVPTEKPNEVRFEQVLIPKSEAVTNIPPITFSYFNTLTSDFRTIKKGPFPITVDPMPQQTAQVITPTPVLLKPETKILGRDIVYLKPAPPHWIYRSDTAWYRTGLFRLLMLVPAGLLLVFSAAGARRRRLRGNAALARRQKAPGAARKQLQTAERALRRNDESAFYEALWNALAAYFGHRLNLAPGEISQQLAADAFAAERERIAEVFSSIELHRYGIQSGDGSKEEMKRQLKALTALLKKCERVKL